MNESNSTRFSSILRLFSLVVALLTGAMTQVYAQPACACHGTIQLSVDDQCEADVTVDMLITNSTNNCDYGPGSIVTLMTSPTSGIISSGLGSARLTNGFIWINKTIYGKVSTPDGRNSCWTIINVEDKMKPNWESTEPDTLVVTCPSMADFVPVALDNCHPPRVFQVSEEIILNTCDRPDLFAGPDTLKIIKRKFRAQDDFGNVSETDCDVVFYVVALDIENIIVPGMVALECDGNWAKLPDGRPSPTDVTINGITYPGTGYPALTPWTGFTSGAGTKQVLLHSNSLILNGGTTGTGGGVVTGAQLCITAERDGNIVFDWNAQMLGPIPPDGNYNQDHAQYTLNGVVTNLTVGGPGSGATPQSGTGVSVAVSRGDQFCFRVRTNNVARWTQLTVSNLSGPFPANRALEPYRESCNLYISYEDTDLGTIKCTRKIMRVWRILEWSCESRFEEFIQMIEISDNKGPVISKLPLTDEATTNGYTCEGIYRLPKPTLTDNCSNKLTYDVTYPGGFLKGLKVTDADVLIPLPVGCNEVKYTAYDECKNKTEQSITVIVKDKTAPVAVCDQHTVVGLTNSGEAWVYATSFDDGSYDDCGIANIIVRRMDEGRCGPCAAPTFDDFTYLGEFTQVGQDQKPHYYYFSRTKVTAEVAFKTAAAMGGYVVALNTSAEADWVHGKVQEWNLHEDYIIGLRGYQGIFDWQSGEDSPYRRWETGYPNNVLLNKNVAVKDTTGQWYNYGDYDCESNELYYVVEIDNPCGFSNSVLFCCTDVGTSHQVVFRVIDKSGNYNDCMVSAVPQDKLPPSMVCPNDVTVSCRHLFDTEKLTASFGWPTTFDNCDNITVTTDSIIDLNSCRIGTITRNFRATDPGGRSVTCRQVITVVGDNQFEMDATRWPADVTVAACGDPSDPQFLPDSTGKPDLTADNICSLVGASYTDQLFLFNDNNGEACFKILRHWKVIDWCQYYLSTGGGKEYRTWTHTQIIMAIDNIKPVILSGCDPASTCTYDPRCEKGYIELTASATDDCTDQMRYFVKVYIGNGSSFDPRFSKSGLATYDSNTRVNTINASGEYPIGTHRIEYAFEDRCGNLTKCSKIFSIVNCKAPTPYCLNGLSTSLMKMADGGMVEIWASDFDNGSSHPCGYKVYHSFEPITLDQNGDPVLKSGRIYTCDSLGRRDVKVYVGVVVDGHVVQDFCSTFIDIQDNLGACKQGNRIVHGTVTNQANQPVSDVLVELGGSEYTSVTNQNGGYKFENINTGASYVLAPSKTDDYLNGVSTLDLVIIQRHILGLDGLNSPYKLIAADVNNDKNITASDLSEIRKLILGTTDSFSNNGSWKFFDNEYKFLDPTAAETENLPTTYYLENIQSDMAVDFKGVKIGDVNESAAANAGSNPIETRTAQRFELATTNHNFAAGQSVEVPVYVSHDVDVAGFQFTVNFDTDLFSLEAINSPMVGINDSNFGLTKLANGAITVSYNRDAAFEVQEGNNILVLTFKAKANGSIDQAMWINSAVTKAEAYNADLHVMNVSFEVQERTNDVVILHQNTPNPFKSVTTIAFELPEAAAATLTVYDVTGKVVKVISNNFNKGYNTIELDRTDLGTSGVMYYTLESGDFKATRKMIVIE